MIAETRYNPHANLLLPWHAIIRTKLREDIACTIPTFCAEDADEMGQELVRFLRKHK